MRAAWSEAYENFYSAWIEKLFDAPLAEQPAWPALQVVLQDRERNFLHDDRGEGEDDGGPRAPLIRPDCADLPYFLRAYFAFKLGLPFAYSTCTRGGSGGPPTCSRLRSNLNPVPQRTREVDTFGDFLPGHGGQHRPLWHRSCTSGGRWRRLLPDPPLVRGAPAGHHLRGSVRSHPRRRQAHPADRELGGCPPRGRRAARRHRGAQAVLGGNFLFAVDPALGSAGFKRFRPLVVDRGRVTALSNAAIAAAPVYGDFALDQYAAGASGFYDRMDDVLSPSPLDPTTALLERVQALEEQVRARVLSVQNGQKHFAGGRGKRIAMPKGSSIFETEGDWEDFSTPARDLRLLIAVDLVKGFPSSSRDAPRASPCPQARAWPT